NIGLVPGGLSAVAGLRGELTGQGHRVRRLAIGSITGSLLGAILLMTLPSSVFDGVVPVLVIGAALLMAAQPMVARRLAARRMSAGRSTAGPGWGATSVTFAAGIYGGYFGAAQGVILMAALAVLVPDELRRTNALKNVLSTIVNLVAAAFFVIFASPAWEVVGLIAAGAVVGGLLGARVARRINPRILRWTVVVVGLVVGIKLLVD
ncbi:MAG TPA: sulfite exporter TauE/SafE family protein, partial [Ilumatobacteraceae bacterium]|nr:sulfite exporter TauE/SafE family protein [Ilumatobacteraceae bacterium]